MNLRHRVSRERQGEFDIIALNVMSTPFFTESPLRLTINIQCDNTTTSHVSLTVQFVKVHSRGDFCKTHLETICFWDSAVYSIVETDALDNQPPPVVEIGELSSLIYRRLCPDLKLDYSLVNATEYLNIHGNLLTSSRKQAIDHDSLHPGPVLYAELKCSVQLAFDTPTVNITKVVQVTVLDKNDNYPELHNGAFHFMMADPQFKKVSLGNIYIRVELFISSHISMVGMYHQGTMAGHFIILDVAMDGSSGGSMD